MAQPPPPSGQLARPAARRPSGFPRGCLIAIVVTLVLGMLAVGTVILVGYVWFENNEGELREAGVKEARVGQSYGAGRDAEACLRRAIARVDACGSDFDVLCQARGRIFVEHCLHAAHVPEGFCDEVPDLAAILDSVAYRSELCTRLDRAGDDRCSRLMEAVQQYCQPTRASPAASPAAP